ncbi:M64 family metallopeptidase [Novosphingobium album (ex Liu et al. 2023)]|uniref:M64 family metallopeptidase n=1 Tax=Novosphingobium album (ex Liu et al. 2023) TaxID=3031130 RepID=A0ABT5WR44_9SPHN|nr:M64 family metallopeptidase [Novosphingobium album (ex Liu et al. 2023)]MDE8652509.1 M64 family metallopeptidase [Novosphingobium album (ex Liu et al. 2023)]
MSDAYLTIRVPLREPGGVMEESAGAPAIELEWIDAQGLAVGAPLLVPPPEQVLSETFGAPGGPQWGHSQADAMVPAIQPESARSLRIGGRGLATRQVTLEAASRRGLGAPDAPPSPRGRADAPWRLAVVADGYPTFAAFDADLERLWRDFSEARPFDTLILEGLVGMVGLYWRSDDGRSLFDARPRDENPWIIYGTHEAVNTAVAGTGESHAKILVVMNRGERGGAGGFDSSRPSWTTNRDSEGESWTQIAIHELGHAFGLADEYATAGNGTAVPDPIEPNVSTEPNPATVSWRSHVTITNGEVPSLPAGMANSYPDGAIGTFQGARYDDTAFFRSSYGCRMKWTTWEFCEVCAAHITDIVRRLG